MSAPHCGTRWPNLGPAGDIWTCTLDAGHEGDHEATGPGGERLTSMSATIPQDHSAILDGDDDLCYCGDVGGIGPHPYHGTVRP